MNYSIRVFMLLVASCVCTACSKMWIDPDAPAVSEERGLLVPPSVPDLAYGRQAPPTLEGTAETIGEQGHQWFFGDGFGKTLASVGGVVAFPPYAIYLVGNAGLAMFGQEPLYVSNLLPPRPRNGVLFVYDAVTSVPGMIAASVSGEEFHTPERLQ
ncbi:MAG: hypothetical protein KDD44_09585 [Bdellovibrionales bacterium]|nr:hypothetical protein [Bdellovibrionales bacterium]